MRSGLTTACQSPRVKALPAERVQGGRQAGLKRYT